MTDAATDAAAAPLRVFLLEDHELVRRGVRELLERGDDIVVVGGAGSAAEALARVPAVRPQVAGLDVRLPDGDGVEVCRELRSQSPDLACPMLTSSCDDVALLDACSTSHVLAELRDRQAADPLDVLTDRERRIPRSPSATTAADCWRPRTGAAARPTETNARSSRRHVLDRCCARGRDRARLDAPLTAP